MMLTVGGISRMCNGNFFGHNFDQLVLQVIDVKPRLRMPLASIVDCHRGLTFSDGCYCVVGFIAKKPEELVLSGKLQIGSVVTITHGFFSSLQNHKVLIIMELAIIREKHDLIGKPVPLHNYPPDIYEYDMTHATQKLLETFMYTENLSEGNVPMASADEDIPGSSQTKENRKKRRAEEPIPRMKLALTKKAELEKAVSELCTDQYKFGFKNAQAQAALLCPVGTDLSAMNMFKRVKNGEIVSDDDEEEE